MSSIEVIKTKTKNRLKLLIDGHYFIKKTVSGDVTYWCCDKRGILQCKSVVRTCSIDGGYEIVYGPTEHSHEDPKNRKLIVATPRKSLFRKASKPSLSKTPVILDFEDHSTTLEHGSDTAHETMTSPSKKKQKQLKKQTIPFVDQPIEPDFGVKEIKFIRWKESQRHKLYIDGFYYSLKTLNKKTCSWGCSHTVANCHAQVTTTFVSGAHKLRDDPTSVKHTHDVTDIPKMLRQFVGQDPLDNHVLTISTPRNKKIKKTRKRVIPFVDQPIEPDFGVKEIKFIRWEENQLHKLFIDGYYYSLGTITLTTCCWFCCQKMNKCSATVTTVFVRGAHKLRDDPTSVKHNHDVNDLSEKLRNYVENIAPLEDDKKETNPPTQCKKEVLRVELPVEMKPPSNQQKKPPSNQQKKPTVTKNLADVSMHTQLLNLIPQGDVVEFQPPVDCEIEFVILFGLRRQMTPEQIFYELQGVYGLDAPTFEVVSDYCNRFHAGYYPKNDPEPKWTSDIQLMKIKTDVNDDPNISKEFLTVQPEIDI